MFPSCGFFSSFPCPYFANGLCERPYCHFRHSKHDIERSQEAVPSSIGNSSDHSAASSGSSTEQPPVSGDNVSESVSTNSEPNSSDEQYFTSTSSEKTSSLSSDVNQELSDGSLSIPSFTDNSSKYQVPFAEEPEQYVSGCPEKKPKEGGLLYGSHDNGHSSLPTYLPTPKTPSLPAPLPTNDDVGVPVYQPTPKRELKRRHQGNTKRNKTNSDLEYDPERNYSCEGLISSSVEKADSNSNDAIEYNPSAKKQRVDPNIDVERNWLSSQLTTGFDEIVEDEDMSCGEFSDEEDGSEQTEYKMEEDSNELQKEIVGKETKSESDEFENIGDDDISSDDDVAMIEVPKIPLNESSADKHPGNRGSSDAKSVVGKKSDKTKVKMSDKAKNAETKKRSDQNIKSTTSHSSSHKLLPKSSTKEKMEKSGKLSAHKVSTKHSHSSEKGSHNISKSSSARNHSSEDISRKTKDSSKQIELSSKTSHSGLRNKISSSSKSSKNISVDKQSSNKTSSKNKSSDKKNAEDIINRHLPEKTVSLKNKQSVSSVSSKHDAKKSDLKRQLSGVDCKNKVSDERRSSSDSKIKSKSDRDMKVAADKGKHVHSENQSSSNKNHSSSSKTSSKCAKLSTGERESGSDRFPSTSSAKSSVSRHDSKSKEQHATCSSSTSGMKNLTENKVNVAKHGTKNSSVDGKSSSSNQKCSSSKNSQCQKVPSVNSTSKSKSDHKREKSGHGKPSSSGDSVLEKMNFNIFGDDSDGDNEVVDSNSEMTATVEDNHSEINDSIDTKTLEERDAVDYNSYINDSDFEDEDTFDECWRIFKENPQPIKPGGQQTKKLAKDQKKDTALMTDSQTILPGKKRTAHKAAEQARKPQLAKKEPSKRLLRPAEVMHNRILEMQRKGLERAKQAVQEQKVSSTSGSTSDSRPQGSGQDGGKKRIAHVPKPATPPAVSKTKPSSSGNDSKITLATTASKTDKRTAHNPTRTNLKRPVIPASFGSKVPSVYRHRYLNVLIDECLKFCESEEKAYKMALEEEATAYERSNNKNIYLRLIPNVVARLRAIAKESLPGTSSSSSSSSPTQKRSSVTQSHFATLGGSRAAKTSFTLHRSAGLGKKVEEELTVMELYQRLLKYGMTEEQLKENGYPRSCPDTPGKAIMQAKAYRDTDTLLKANERTCCRCGVRFMINADGSYVQNQECIYHWARAYPRKKSGFIQHIYNCCNSDTSSQGCQMASNHVHDQNRRDSVNGFMSTMPRSGKDGNPGIYALDCEMVYTQGGLELARVTVVDTEGESVYESLVQPYHPIVDFNTRFSGITASDLHSVTTTLTDVQAVLLNLFSSKSILIGHSLESDLIALKLIHSTVVDTSIVFPHRLGPPYKRALKNLMLETFQKIIQCDDDGHDSKEDAVACLQLMKWRIKEDSKRDYRHSRD